MNFGVLLGFSSSFLIDDWHRSSLLPDLAARRWIWQSLILGSDQTFVILVLFMEMLLWLLWVLNVHPVISTISTWFFFFISLGEMLTWIKISWVLDAHVWMFICWLCGNPEIDWRTYFEHSAGLGKNGYSSRLQCLKVLEWLNRKDKSSLSWCIFIFLNARKRIFI